MGGIRNLVAERLRKLGRNGRGKILIAIATGWFLSIGVRNIFPVLLPYLRESFAMSLTASGILFTVLWVAYALGQFPGGLLVDRIGGRNILVLSTAISVMTIIILIISLNIWMLFFGTILFGLATALYGPARFTVLSDIYNQNDGLAIGITLAAGNIGNAILPVIAGILATYLMWQIGFGFVIPLFIVASVALWVSIPEYIGTETGSERDSNSLLATFQKVGHAIARPQILIIVLILLINTFILQGFTGFYPTYLVDIKSVTPSLASILFGVFFTTGIVVQPLSGVGNDNFSPSLTIAISLGLIVVGLFVLPYIHQWHYLIFPTLVMSALMGTPPTATSHLVSLLPEEVKGSGLGLLRTIYMLIASTGSIFVGYFADIGYFDESFTMLGFLALIGVLLAILHYYKYE